MGVKAPPEGLTIRISKSNVADIFKNLLIKRYPDGLTVDDAKIWREPIKIITKRDRIHDLDPKPVTKNPKKARDDVGEWLADRVRLPYTAIALQYLIEGGNMSYFIANPAQLNDLFRGSKEGMFTLNPGYTAHIVD